jgi:hypothetical protein
MTGIKNYIVLFYILSSYLCFCMYWAFGYEFFTIPSQFLVLLSFLILLNCIYLNEKKYFIYLITLIFIIMFIKYNFDSIVNYKYSYMIFKSISINVIFNYALGFYIFSYIIRTGEKNYFFNFYIVIILLSTLLFVVLFLHFSGVVWYANVLTSNLYQTFAAYHFRIVIILLFLILYTPFYVNSIYTKIFFTAFIAMISLYFCILTGAKKEILIAAYLIFCCFWMIQNLILRNIFIRIFSSGAIFVLTVFYVFSNFNYFEDIYLFHIIQRSLEDRLHIISEIFLKALAFSPFFGDHYSYLNFGDLYVHSLPLNLINSFGLFVGMFLFLFLIFVFCYKLRLNIFRTVSLLVLIIACIATSYDWMLLWFTAGCVRATTTTDILGLDDPCKLKI